MAHAGSADELAERRRASLSAEPIDGQELTSAGRMISIIGLASSVCLGADIGGARTDGGFEIVPRDGG